MPETPGEIEVRTEDTNVRGANRSFVRPFQLGRAAACEVRVHSSMVSRVHAEIEFADGRWWIRDNDSTNGTFVDGERIQRMALPAEAEVQLGQNGPRFHLQVPGAVGPAPDATQAEVPTRSPSETKAEAGVSYDAPSAPGAASTSGRPDASVSQYIDYYFEEQDRPAGEHTQMLRQAYQKVKEQQKRRYSGLIIGVLVLCVGLGAYAVMQHLRNAQLEETAQQVFVGMKEQDVFIAQLRRKIEQSGNASLSEQLAALEAQRQKQQARYAGYVEELGLYRELTPKEQEIYQVARIFGESEFSIPAGFIRKVKDTIENYWLGPARRDFAQSIQRANEQGYTSLIVRTMRAHGLPPEFFYLALQESRLNTEAVGPPTRWGIAKGMWQFIPSTAQRHGLRVGPRADTRIVDPQDERHDFRKSTRAAAQYLRTIYSTKAQASGLLVIASYNWGEHRIINKLERLPGPQGIPQEALEGIPRDPDERNYWRFLREYSDRMPEQTKDYVLKVVAAAVIGQNPRLYGFEFDNPLQPYMEAPATPGAVS